VKLFVVSGRSGSGKSTALHMLEDLDFYCIDNLPVSLLPYIPENLSNKDSDPNQPQKVAVGIDARNMPADLERFSELIESMPPSVDLHILYLDAKDETLIKRFSETRRKHPLSGDLTSLPEALIEESKKLENIATKAHLTIDTSEMNLYDLREFIRDRVDASGSGSVAIMFQSFGFKENIPIDSDLVFDVRCLPNPYWNKALREFSGRDQPIIDFLSIDEDVKQMLADIRAFLMTWIPRYEASDRRYITISIGCTGGKHRSVFVADFLGDFFSRHYSDVKVRHRQLASDK